MELNCSCRFTVLHSFLGCSRTAGNRLTSAERLGFLGMWPAALGDLDNQVIRTVQVIQTRRRPPQSRGRTFNATRWADATPQRANLQRGCGRLGTCVFLAGCSSAEPVALRQIHEDKTLTRTQRVFLIAPPLPKEHGNCRRLPGNRRCRPTRAQTNNAHCPMLGAGTSFNLTLGSARPKVA